MAEKKLSDDELNIIDSILEEDIEKNSFNENNDTNYSLIDNEEDAKDSSSEINSYNEKQKNSENNINQKVFYEFDDDYLEEEKKYNKEKDENEDEKSLDETVVYIAPKDIEEIARKEREEELKKNLKLLADLLDTTLDNLNILEKNRESFFEFQKEILSKAKKFEVCDIEELFEDEINEKIADERVSIEKVNKELYDINLADTTFEDYDYYLSRFEEYEEILDSDNEIMSKIIKLLNREKEYLENSLFDGIRNRLCELVRNKTVLELEDELMQYSTKDNIIDKIFKRDKLKEKIRKNISIKIKLAFNIDILVDIYTIADIAKYLKNMTSHDSKLDEFAKSIEEVYGINAIKRRRNIELITLENTYKLKYFGNTKEIERISNENSKLKKELKESIIESEKNKKEENLNFVKEININVRKIKLCNILKDNLNVIFEEMEG